MIEVLQVIQEVPKLLFAAGALGIGGGLLSTVLFTVALICVRGAK